MGSGDWLKNIISLNKARKQRSNKMKDCSLPETNGFILKPWPPEEPKNIVIDVANGQCKAANLPTEDMAATRIQTAFRAFTARKIFLHSKRIVKLQTLTQGDYGKKQTLTTLRYLQSWSRIQAQIRTRRLGIMEESGIKKKKSENKLKLEAKLRDLEVEWSGGSHTMVETLARIKQREEATIKRDRAMAYAFSHQWRANSKSNPCPYESELATANWGWSWMERWIVARPWETRAVVGSTPKKVNSPSNKKSPSIKKSNLLKNSPNGKKTARSRKLPYGSTTRPEDANTKPGKHTN